MSHPCRTWEQPDWTLDQLLAAKAGRTVSVMLPALNEQTTVGQVVASVQTWQANNPAKCLVDELIVIDAGSQDQTAAVARAAGAQVVAAQDACPTTQVRPGKGETLWRSVMCAGGDIIVFLDTDLIDPDPQFVPKLLGPLLLYDNIQLVKGFYRRPLQAAGQEQPTGGGRVNELAARPLLAALRPQLGEIIQPLGGEYAARKDFLTSVPFASGYGVDVGLLLDAFHRHGSSSIAQVQLGVRKHRNRSLIELAPMSRQIIGTILRRCEIADETGVFIHFSYPQDQTAQLSEYLVRHETAILLDDRPPINSWDC